MRDRRLTLALFALIAAGFSVYGSRGSIGLWVTDWERVFGTGREEVSRFAAIGFVGFGVGVVLAGRLMESRPGRGVLLTGVALTASGFALAATGASYAITLVGVGFVAGLGGGLAGVVTTSVIATRLFRERHGAIYGVLASAGAGGQVLVLLVATGALRFSGLTASLLAVALVIALSAIAVIVFVPRDDPAVTGTRADATSVGLGGIAREPRFWCLFLGFLVCGYTSSGLVDPHLIPYAESHHLSKGLASTITATLAGFNVLGTLVAGVLTDRVDRGTLLAAIYAVRGLTVLALPFLGTPELLFAFAVVYGLADFASVPPTTSLCRSAFPAGGFALALALISGVHQIGAALGSWTGGILYDATGGYGVFFAIAAATLAVAAAISYVLGDRRPLRPPVPVAA